jgi:adenine-specific DNA-methyltransferase
VIAVEESGAISEVWTGRYIFENQWQDFRTHDERSLRTVSAPHTYDTPGEYKVAVKVVDVFGNDTTKVVKVKIK